MPKDFRTKRTGHIPMPKEADAMQTAKILMPAETNQRQMLNTRSRMGKM